MNDTEIVMRIKYLLASDSDLENMITSEVTQQTGISPEDFDDEEKNDLFCDTYGRLMTNALVRVTERSLEEQFNGD